MGTRGGAGDGCCSSLSSRVVLGKLLLSPLPRTQLQASMSKRSLPPATAVVAVVAGTCLEEVDTVAKAQACCWSNRSC